MSRATECIHARQYGPDLWCSKAKYTDCQCLIDQCKPCNEEEVTQKIAEQNNYNRMELKKGVIGDT